MNEDKAIIVLERMLAMTLRHGTRLATIVVVAGLLVGWILAAHHPAGGPAPMPIVSVGIFLFLMLPTARVGLMLLVFLRARDYRFAAMAAAVLAIIALGFVSSLLWHAHH